MSKSASEFMHDYLWSWTRKIVESLTPDGQRELFTRAIREAPLKQLADILERGNDEVHEIVQNEIERRQPLAQTPTWVKECIDLLEQGIAEARTWEGPL